MSWQDEDGDANRQGLTIAEYGELGGPGMGGCPAGPTDQAAPAASYCFVRSTDKTKLAVSWTPATPAPGAPAGHRLQRRGDRPGQRLRRLGHRGGTHPGHRQDHHADRGPG